MTRFLVLEIIAGEGAESLPEREHVFDYTGGGIGRDEGNAWVIPKPASVHRRHANVRFQSGVFWIEKLGDNTVAIDSPDRDIAQHDACALRDGCRLYIDAYEIAVRTTRERPPAPPPPAREAVSAPTDPPDARTWRPPPLPVREGPPGSPGAGRQIDDLLGEHVRRGAPVTESFAPALDRAPAFADRIALPTGVAAPKADDFWEPTRLPPDLRNPPAPAPGAPPAAADAHDFWEATRLPEPEEVAAFVARPRAEPRRAPAVVDEPPVPGPSRPPQAGNSELRLGRLLSHLGVQAAAVRDEDIDVLGRTLREALEGAIGLLQAREQASSRLGLGRASLMPHASALSRMPNAQAALASLVTHRLPGAPGLDEALRRAFHDLAWHEVAVADAINATRLRFLELFDPAALERRADETARRGALTSRAKTLWELYVERFDQLAGESGETFRRWFAKEFAREYERALGEHAQGRQRTGREGT